MSSKRFNHIPTAQQASALLPQRAGKQGMTGQLFPLCPQDAQHDTGAALAHVATVNAQGNPMTTQLPQTTPCAAQGAPIATAVVVPAAAQAAGLVAGAHAVAEPCMPEAQAQHLWHVPTMPVATHAQQAANAETTEGFGIEMCWHTQELFVGTKLNINLLPCLGLLGDDIDFPGPHDPGGIT